MIAGYGVNAAVNGCIWMYSIGVTEARNPMYDYPEYSFKTTDEFTNLG